jgi:putative heme-binding domain-containing protein
MALTRVKELPALWLAPLAGALTSADPAIAALAVAVARTAPAPKSVQGELNAALTAAAHDRSNPVQVRLGAFSAIVGSSPVLDDEMFALLRESLAPQQPVPAKMAAATIVEKASLTREQLVLLVDAVREAGPLELPRLLPAFDGGSDEALGLQMLAALEQSSGRSNVRASVLRPRLEKYPPSVQARGEALLATMRADAAQQAARLDQLLAGMLGGGDVRRGQMLFNSPKAACASCHAIGYRGGQMGPDLTAIGQIRSERDLLEAIVYPSASFARGYEPLVVTTTTGESHAGVLHGERTDDVVLMVGQGEETRIPRSRVADMQPGDVSMMPAGYAEQLTRQELADLLAFLKGTRWGAN